MCIMIFGVPGVSFLYLSTRARCFTLLLSSSKWVMETVFHGASTMYRLQFRSSCLSTSDMACCFSSPLRSCIIFSPGSFRPLFISSGKSRTTVEFLKSPAFFERKQLYFIHWAKILWLLWASIGCTREGILISHPLGRWNRSGSLSFELAVLSCSFHETVPLSGFSGRPFFLAFTLKAEKRKCLLFARPRDNTSSICSNWISVPL